MGKTAEKQFQEIRYIREVKPPTLKQYIFRRAAKSAMEKGTGQTGVILNPDTKRPAPSSAIKVGELLKGVTAEKLMVEHPEWVEDYKKEFSDGSGNKEA